MNRTTSRRLRYALVVVCLSAGAGIALSQDQVPRFEPGDCALPAPPTEQNVRCGYLVVPENRTAKSGKTIRLPIVILKTESPNPKPDPVLKTLGGPGGSSLR